MKLYIVRHGETPWNELTKIQGHMDIPLNSTGLSQAAITRDLLKDIKIDRIFSSPLKRAKMTADVINENYGLQIICDDRLKERDYGEFTGFLRGTYDYKGMWKYRENNTYKLAENVQVFFKRIYDFLDEIKAKYPNDNVLVVAHAGVMKAVECYAHGILPDDEIGPFVPKNCSYLEYDI